LSWQKRRHRFAACVTATSIGERDKDIKSIENDVLDELLKKRGFFEGFQRRCTSDAGNSQSMSRSSSTPDTQVVMSVFRGGIKSLDELPSMMPLIPEGGATTHDGLDSRSSIGPSKARAKIPPHATSIKAFLQLPPKELEKQAASSSSATCSPYRPMLSRIPQVIPPPPPSVGEETPLPPQRLREPASSNFEKDANMLGAMRQDPFEDAPKEEKEETPPLQCVGAKISDSATSTTGDSKDGRYDSKKTRPMSRLEIISGRADELTHFNHSDEFNSIDTDFRRKSMPILFRVFGIAPWSEPSSLDVHRCWRPAVWYQWFVMAVLGLACGVLVTDFVYGRDDFFNGGSHVNLLSDLPLAAGTFCALLALGAHGGSSALCQIHWLLQVYLHRYELHCAWNRRKRSDEALMGAAALCFGLVRIYFLYKSGGSALAAASFILTGAVVMIIMTCVLHSCRALAVMVDGYCSLVTEQADISEAIYEWNVLQAVLRKTSTTMEWCLIVLQATAAAMVPLFVTDFFALGGGWDAMCPLCPGILLLLGIMRMQFCAASVSDKCTRVASLINFMSFGEGTERERALLVEYIVQSVAGFYVFEVRFTTAIALNIVYFWGAVAFSLATRVVSHE